MRRLQEFDIRERYNNEALHHPPIADLQHILEDLGKGQTTLHFREGVFLTIEMLLDGLVVPLSDNHVDQIWKEQKRVLEKSLKIGERFAGEFYGGRKVDMEAIGQEFRVYADRIVQYGSKDISERRWLKDKFWRLKTHADALPEILEKIRPDIIVPIGSGGIEPGCIAGYITETAQTIPVRYSPNRRHDSKPKIPAAADEREYLSPCNGKTVLVVDDDICEGSTMKSVLSYLAGFRPASMYAMGMINGNFSSLLGLGRLNYREDCQLGIVKVDLGTLRSV
ncbi:MAG: hypothetical protein HY362_02500 [Candidatus Aenigmarchaeota archaeon]|nr:hypothetical protein [Candidatus Aenigmarchaeota archaeon]